MSKLIQKAGFLSPKRAGRYMNYIATRDGVELLDENADSIYMRYIATRPRAERHGEHGLFGAEDGVIQEAERLRLQLEESSEQTSANLPFATENTSSVTSQSVRLPSEYLLNSTVRLFHQMGRILRDNAAPPSNPMGIRIDSKRRKKLMQKRLAMGHKQDNHEQVQGYEQSL